MFDLLVGALDDAGVAGFDELDDAGVIELASVWHRLESVVAERKYAAAAELFRRYRERDDADGGWVVDAFDQAEAEIGVALGISRRAAGDVVGFGDTLASRLPRFREAIAGGLLSVYQARQVESATRNVSEAMIAPVEEQILARMLARGGTATGRRLRDIANRVITAHDPDGIRARRQCAQDERYVEISTAEDGMVNVLASLRCDDGRFLDARVTEMAKEVCADDPRTFMARRADALIALAHGEPRLVCQCGTADCTQRAELPVRRKPVVHVILTDTALSGRDQNAPAYLDGHGIIDGALAREIAAQAVVRPLNPQASSSSADELPCAPESAASDDHDATLMYRPSQQVSDQSRAEHGTCQWPHCDRAAWECDLDHNEAFNHANPKAGGRTIAANLGPFCRGHHRVKTFCGWSFTPGPRGTTLLHTPSGRHYTLYTSGPVELLTGRPSPITLTESTLAPRVKKSRTRAQTRASRVRAERRINQGIRCRNNNTADAAPPF